METGKIDERLLLPKNTLLQTGKYRIVRHLSSGGFGNTYEVMNVEFEERMALKEFFIKGISERDADNTTVSVSNTLNKGQFEAQKDKFKKEARRLRKLHNPHIVQVHDLFEENGTAYYAMDFIDGESLSDRLKRTKKPLSEAETLKILNEVLDALEEVHAQRIWHLDLKPGNIMVGKEGVVKLIDFGASKQISATEGYTTTTTAMCYTPGYAPTEQIDQKMELIGPWTDLYALGGTLYNLLTCNQPPTVSEMQEDDAFSYPNEVSSNTKNLIRWMMSPRRQQRPQSVAEVRDYLKKSFAKSTIDDSDEVTILEPEKNTNQQRVHQKKKSFAKSTIDDKDEDTVYVSQKKTSEKKRAIKDDDKKLPVNKKWIGAAVAGLLVAGLLFLILRPSGEDSETQPVGLCPDSNHPHAIDLGLPSGTKWACCNVGASEPEGYGGYYAWGETKAESAYQQKDVSDIAGTRYDAATANWGAPWKMPTKSQCEELIENTTYKWTTHNGVKGGMFTSKKNGRSLFLPAAGDRCWYGELYNAGSYGYYYWSSSLGESGQHAGSFYFYSGAVNTNVDDRSVGLSVRPVR